MEWSVEDGVGDTYNTANLPFHMFSSSHLPTFLPDSRIVPAHIGSCIFRLSTLALESAITNEQGAPDSTRLVFLDHGLLVPGAQNELELDRQIPVIDVGCKDLLEDESIG